MVSLPTMGAEVPIDTSKLPVVSAPNYLAAYLRGFGWIFNFLPTNLLLNIVHLLFGLFGLYSATGDRGSFNYNRFFAIVFLMTVVLGQYHQPRRYSGLCPYSAAIWR